MQFKKIIGQRKLINQLTRVIDEGKVSHAQLFVGNMGYGTLAMAMAYAQYLNCQNRQHFGDEGDGSGLMADSCGECPSCKKISSLMHSDLHIIFPNTSTKNVTKNPSSADFQNEFREYVTANGGYCSFDGWFRHLGVESKQGLINVRDGRDLIRELSLKTYESKYKTAIVWLPEKMNADTANKLLKTIEEPSENTLILLVAEERERLLPTIISRTQPVNLHRIDDQSLYARLSQEHTEIPSETLNDIVVAAEGNYLLANEFVSQSEQRRYFAELFVNWMRKLFKLDIKNLSKTVEEICSLGQEQQKQFLRYVLDVLRACFIKTATGRPSPHMLSFDDEKFANAFPAMITVRNIERLEKDINESLYNISRNAYDKITFMSLSFAISKSLKNK
ncbi:MAG: hypothetical protein J5605_08985 [Bacteroidales bacterium]|jgi:DNA polymerase-3 subunit delta'|nr:hypothetical protein [Bacteroidales bacterium]